MGAVLTIQGQMVEIPLPLPLERFPVLSLFFQLSLPKSWYAHSQKILFSKLTRTGRLPHKVDGLEVENCGLTKHFKLGDFDHVFSIIGKKAHVDFMVVMLTIQQRFH